MAVTLDTIDIESVISIDRIQRPSIRIKQLGFHALSLVQHLKNTLHQYQVSGSWMNGDTDYDAKEREIQNIQDAGLPIWFESTEWRKNAVIFGKITDFDCHERSGRPEITDFSFTITSCFPWGYIFIQDDGNGDFRIYDLGKRVQSRTINPILRKCSWAKTSTQITFSIFVKNIGGLSGQVTLEMMVPDGVTTSNITTNQTTTKLAGDVATSGFSSVPGSRNRITLKRTLGAGVEEQWNITIAFGANIKTSYIDGSIDEIAA